MSERELVYVIGHRNPDTDSICSAICYARLKREVDGGEYVAARAGQMNEETQFVLDYFGVKAPRLVENITTQVCDIEIRKTQGIKRRLSIKRAWNMMQENHVVTVPVVDDAGGLEGLITVGDIAKSYMNVYDNHTLSEAETPYENIADTLQAAVVTGDVSRQFTKGKVLIAAANPDKMENFIQKGDLVILGNRYESQLCAIEMDAACLIVCEGAPVSKTIQKLAQERDCMILSTTFDTFTVSRLINQSIPVEYFMRTDKLITFEAADYLDEVKEVMASKRHRDFPVMEEGKYIGMVSRRNLLGARGKQVILVDHNEKNQTVEGIDYADIKEIIDHHRIGTVETLSPVFFRNQPLGCTATIIYQMYCESGVEIDPVTAGLLCSAIISDTLMFRSPTSTEVDRTAAEELSKLAGLDMDSYADAMFSAGSNLKGKTAEEIFYQDYKRFTAGKLAFGVGQMTGTGRSELMALKQNLIPLMERKLADSGNLAMLFFMLTNILTETTTLLCVGNGSRQLIQTAFGEESQLKVEWEDEHTARIEGLMSRKKQLIPQIIMAAQERSRN